MAGAAGRLRHGRVGVGSEQVSNSRAVSIVGDVRLARQDGGAQAKVCAGTKAQPATAQPEGERQVTGLSKAGEAVGQGV